MANVLSILDAERAPLSLGFLPHAHWACSRTCSRCFENAHFIAQR